MQAPCGTASGPGIISVHVPKTAGISLYTVFTSLYGESEVEFHHLGEARSAVAARKEWPRVITGHFWLGTYEPHFPDAFKLVWLREPAALLISWFFFWKHGPKMDGPELCTSVRAGLVSLEEFVEHPDTRNLVSRAFLTGYALSDLDFVGITEHFADDLQVLGERLEWPPTPAPRRINVNVAAEYEEFRPTRRLLRRIRRLNRDDVELYSEALELRRRRARQARQSLV